MKGLRSLGGKNVLRVLLILAVALVTARAEDKLDRSSPEAVIRSFYHWYVQALVNHREPFTKERAELKRYATARLLHQIDQMRKGPDGLDGDYFLDAQDFDRDWGNNITVSTPIVKDRHAAVEVELKSKEMGTRHLLVDLAWEDKGWKVDNVQSQN